MGQLIDRKIVVQSYKGSFPKNSKIRVVLLSLVSLGSITFSKVLCDLGASINLMPFSVDKT